MAFIKEESADFRIDEVFSVKQEEPEEKIAEQPCPSHTQFMECRNSKSKERQSFNCGPKGRFKPKERKHVQTNVGLMVPNETDGTALKPLRGKTVQLFTDPEVAAPDLLKQAVQRMRTFNKDMPEGPYVLLYPDCSEVAHVPGSERPFKLEEYKKEIRKPYSRITFFICLEKHYKGDPMELKEECEALNEMEEKHQYETQDDFKTEEKFQVGSKISWQISDQMTGRSNFTCQQCGLHFSEKGNFTCKQCGNSYTQNGNLKIHMGPHTREKPYTQCGKHFSQKDDLNRHIRGHTREKPYNCPQCGKCFIQKGHLNRHIRNHTGGWLHNCELCGKSFSQKDDLNRHIRVHTGVKPYTCPQCEKCFTLKDHLRKHITIHTGEKSFSCKQCGKCFSQNGNLKVHMKIHTGGKPYASP